MEFSIERELTPLARLRIVGKPFREASGFTWSEMTSASHSASGHVRSWLVRPDAALESLGK